MTAKLPCEPIAKAPIFTHPNRLTQPESPINSWGYGILRPYTGSLRPTLWASGRVPDGRGSQTGGSVPLPRSNAGQLDVERTFARRALGPRSRMRGGHTLARADGYRPDSGAWSTRVCIC